MVEVLTTRLNLGYEVWVNGISNLTIPQGYFPNFPNTAPQIEMKSIFRHPDGKYVRAHIIYILILRRRPQASVVSFTRFDFNACPANHFRNYTNNLGNATCDACPPHTYSPGGLSKCAPYGFSGQTFSDDFVFSGSATPMGIGNCSGNFGAAMYYQDPVVIGAVSHLCI